MALYLLRYGTLGLSFIDVCRPLNDLWLYQCYRELRNGEKNHRVKFKQAFNQSTCMQRFSIRPLGKPRGHPRAGLDWTASLDPQGSGFRVQGSPPAPRITKSRKRQRKDSAIFTRTNKTLTFEFSGGGEGRGTNIQYENHHKWQRAKKMCISNNHYLFWTCGSALLSMLQIQRQ